MEEAGTGKQDQIFFVHSKTSYIYIFESNFFIIPQRERDDCRHMFHTCFRAMLKILGCCNLKGAKRNLVRVFYI